jgi:hypothetical protein
MLTQSRLKEMVYYNPETGDFIWIGHRYNSRNGSIAGFIHSEGYRNIKIDNVIYYAHRLAWLYVYGKHPSKQIDHINCVKDDNRIDNLREASPSENMQNMVTSYSNNKQGILGVCFQKKMGKFQAQIMKYGKNKYLGCFYTKEEAHKAYLEAKSKIHAFSTIGIDLT